MAEEAEIRAPGPGRTVLRGGVVFDGTGTAPFRADVALGAGRIVEVGDALEGSSVIDAANATVMPGLIDCHAHPAFADPFGTLDADVERPSTYATLQAIPALRATLDAGVTTVRDAAGADAGLRLAIAEGLVIGPRLLVSLMQLSPSAGPYDTRSPSGHDTWIARPGIPSPVADGPAALRAKVREFAQAGADVVKIFAGGHFAMARDGARRSLFTSDELDAIVDEARRQQLRVMAHAHGAEPAAAAARSGVASIEHGFFLDEAALVVMRDAGTIFVPTLLASAGVLERATDEATRARMQAVADDHRRAVAIARRVGVQIAMGTDCPVAAHGRNDEELGLLVACGLTSAEALAAGTSVAARLLGLEDEIGRIGVGLRADVLVVDGNVDDVSAFRARLRHVFKDGRRLGPRLSA